MEKIKCDTIEGKLLKLEKDTMLVIKDQTKAINGLKRVLVDHIRETEDYKKDREVNNVV